MEKTISSLSPRLRVAALVAVMSLQGCMLATQEDILKLDSDLNKMRQGQADVITKMSELSGNLQSLNSQLESSQQRMTLLSQKLDDLQADIDQRMKVLKIFSKSS